MEQLTHTADGRLVTNRTKEDHFLIVGSKFKCTRQDYTIYNQIGTITEVDVKRNKIRHAEFVSGIATTFYCTFAYGTTVFPADVELIEE